MKSNITKKIVKRDVARAGKNYFKSLRGYHTRKNILENMFNSLNKRILPKRKRIYLIDLGCGPGIVGKYFFNKLSKKYDIEIHFLDINPKMLEIIPKNKNFKKILGDVTKLKVNKNFYHIATMKQVLDYLPKNMQIKTIKNIYKILRKNGQFILSALIPPNDADFYLKLNNYLYTEREKIINPLAPIKKYIARKKEIIKWLENAGFKKTKIRYIYDIPLSVKDFVKSFGLNKIQELKMKKLYNSIIKKDKLNCYRWKILKGKDIELIEKAVVISAIKI